MLLKLKKVAQFNENLPFDPLKKETTVEYTVDESLDNLAKIFDQAYALEDASAGNAITQQLAKIIDKSMQLLAKKPAQGIGYLNDVKGRLDRLGPMPLVGFDTNKVARDILRVNIACLDIKTEFDKVEYKSEARQLIEFANQKATMCHLLSFNEDNYKNNPATHLKKLFDKATSHKDSFDY